MYSKSAASLSFDILVYFAVEQCVVANILVIFGKEAEFTNWDLWLTIYFLKVIVQFLNYHVSQLSKYKGNILITCDVRFFVL